MRRNAQRPEHVMNRLCLKNHKCEHRYFHEHYHEHHRCIMDIIINVIIHIIKPGRSHEVNSIKTWPSPFPLFANKLFVITHVWLILQALITTKEQIFYEDQKENCKFKFCGYECITLRIAFRIERYQLVCGISRCIGVRRKIAFDVEICFRIL